LTEATGLGIDLKHKQVIDRLAHDNVQASVAFSIAAGVELHPGDRVDWRPNVAEATVLGFNRGEVLRASWPADQPNNKPQHHQRPRHGVFSGKTRSAGMHLSCGTAMSMSTTLTGIIEKGARRDPPFRQRSDTLRATTFPMLANCGVEFQLAR
jgi:hypothetical protein